MLNRPPPAKAALASLGDIFLIFQYVMMKYKTNYERADVGSRHARNVPAIAMRRRGRLGPIGMISLYRS